MSFISKASEVIDQVLGESFLDKLYNSSLLVMGGGAVGHYVTQIQTNPSLTAQFTMAGLAIAGATVSGRLSEVREHHHDPKNFEQLGYAFDCTTRGNAYISGILMSIFVGGVTLLTPSTQEPERASTPMTAPASAPTNTRELR